MDSNKIYIILLLICILLCILIIHNQKSEQYGDNFSLPSFNILNEYSHVPLKFLKDLPYILFKPSRLLKGFDDPYNTPSRYVVEFLIKYGQYRVIGLQLCRSPLPSVIRNLINYITLGNFNEEMKIRGMDDIFHLWLNITLTNGEDTFTIKTEKRSIIEFSDQDLIAQDCFVIKGIPDDNQLTLNELFENAIKIHPFDFYLYDGRNNNCQEYVRSLLKGSGYLSEEANQFLYQNAQQLFDSLGFRGQLVGNFIKRLSNLAANATRYIYDK